jgi:aryl-alcohol dehydrogenase-like predicted oxidoreductase
MQLAGPGVFGPPRDHDQALAVLRPALEAGVNHFDTSDFYGPRVTNRLIREALSPYPQDLLIVTKIGARRGDDASWLPAFAADELARAVDDNVENLGLEALDVVNLRLMFDVHGPAEGSLAAPLKAVADLQRQGLVRHIGLSNVTRMQFEEAWEITNIVCVQNQYNLAHRDDDAFVDALAAEGSPTSPFFRSAASARCNRRHYPTSQLRSRRRRCRSRLPGCSSDRPTSCSSRALRRWRISTKIWPLPR